MAPDTESERYAKSVAPYGQCQVCSRPITEAEYKRLRSDIDFVEHDGHLIRVVRPHNAGHCRWCGAQLTRAEIERAAGICSGPHRGSEEQVQHNDSGGSAYDDVMYDHIESECVQHIDGGR